ncbi:hypothetical protein MMC07_006461 [Pseudocyphellaria aurata]|nr:hypothetical protein [Pseudocyphellaria aurata]
MESSAGPSDPKANIAADQPHIEKRSQRDDGDDAASPSSLLTPLPEARTADTILIRLKKLHLTSDEDLKNLYRERRRVPVVMLPLAGDYCVAFGRPRLAREPFDFGTGETRIDTHDIHPFLSGINWSEASLCGLVSDIPKLVFDIGGLFLKSHAPTDTYHPIDYRVVLDMHTRAIWLLYEYSPHDPDPDFQEEEKVAFCMNATWILQQFDPAKVLDSTSPFRDGLDPIAIEKNMRNNDAVARVYFAGILYVDVEKYSKAPLE